MCCAITCLSVLIIIFLYVFMYVYDTYNYMHICNVCMCKYVCVYACMYACMYAYDMYN